VEEDTLRRSISILLLALIAVGLLASACSSSQAAGPNMQKMNLAPVSELPKDMQMAPERVRTAYQFAVANPDALKNVPCYCGCGAMGHTSNYSCYITDVKDGKVTAFDDHALGCSLCVDITQEVMQLSGQGTASASIRARIVADFSKFGPANQ
jgi:hypothetical protein